ncbi:MAG: ATP-grasp domain-containing protein [Gemmataceae bacterium]
MKLGLAYTLKSDHDEPDQPDDWQEEFDSPATIRAIQSALEQLGHSVTPLGDGRQLLQRLLAAPPEMVFNIAEGRGVSRNRESRVPAICEILNVPCTGSDPLALAASLDKDVARRLVASTGVAVPRGQVIERAGSVSDGVYSVANASGSSKHIFPAIVKPAWEGSSKGIRGKCVVKNDRELQEAIARLGEDYRQPLLVEEFIAGDELTVGVIGNSPPEVLGIMRVVPQKPTKEFVYSLEVKRDWQNQVRYQTPPAGYDQLTLTIIENAALTAFQALGCRDIARIDFRLRDGVPHFIEANPLPGLNPETGDIVLIAKAMGVSHTELIGRILSAAMKRNELVSRDYIADLAPLCSRG